MGIFDLTTYMQDVAERHEDIKHTSSEKHFFQIAGMGHLNQFMDQINQASSPALCVDVNPDGQIISSLENNSVDVPTYRFLVLYHALPGNYADIKSAKEQAKALGFKILAKLSFDKHQAEYNEADNGLLYLDLNFQYQNIGPVAQSWYGCMFTFRLQQSAIDEGMVYNADEYAT
jgi:hypothetical protein